MFNLIDELEKYTPFDQLEAEHVKKTLNFLKNNTNCFDRSNKSGHVTAGGLVCDGKGNILLNHHKTSGMWFQFGGHSDGEADSLNVAKREIMEEAGITNLELKSNKIFDVAVQKIKYNYSKNEPEHLHYDINFLFFVKTHDFKISNESKEIKWVTIDEAKKLVSPTDDAIQRMIAKYEIICTNYQQDDKKTL